MVRKPGRMYRELKGHAYTRKEYIKGAPPSKVTIFDMGDPDGDFPVKLSLLAEEDCQIRHIALEAARVAANRYLLREVGRESFYLKLRVYPHHVLREHKYAVGAGADRISEGMRLAFGRPVGTAARVRRGQKIFTLAVKPENFSKAKEALRRAGHKLPTPCKIIVEEGADLVKAM